MQNPLNRWADFCNSPNFMAFLDITRLDLVEFMGRKEMVYDKKNMVPSRNWDNHYVINYKILY